MPLHCPRCRIVQADENQTCINCGEPLPPPAPALPAAAPFADPERLAEADAATYLADQDDPAGVDSVHAVQAHRASWKMPALIVVGLLLALIVGAVILNQRKAAVRTASPQTPVTIPPIAAAPIPAASPTITAAKDVKTAPLALSLTATEAGRRISVGSNVTLTVFTTHAQGRSAAMTLSYRRNQGRRMVLAFAQGSLCTTTWTPQTPGRYEFSATALDGGPRAVAARPVTITVSDSTVLTAQPSAVMPAAPRVTVHALPTKTHSSISAMPPPRSRLLYHVEAAHFPFVRNAAVLAAALRRQGIPAVAQRITDRRGKPVYIVETGTYHRLGAVRKAVLTLQRSGYPAYFYGTR